MKKSLALSALLGTGVCADGTGGTEANVTIRLVNSAKVAGGTLAGPEQSRYVLARAGIKLI